MNTRLIVSVFTAACLVAGVACTVDGDAAGPAGDATLLAAPAGARPRPPEMPSAEVTANRTAYTPAQSGIFDRLQRALHNPELRVSGPMGLTVVDEAGRTIIEHDARTELIPASTQKLVTAAAALLEHGSEYRFITHVDATAPIGPDGTIAGDLVLVGAGDPVLATPLFERDVWPQRPRTELEKLANRLVRAGVKRVTGDVVGDGTLYAREYLAPGWSADYLRDLDATNVAGLTVNAGRRLFMRGGRLVGEPAKSPATEAAAMLAQMLRKRGVTVAGRARAATAPTPGAENVAAVASPPLIDLLRHTIQESDNHLADGIFRTLGTDAGASTWQSSGETARRILAELGLDTTEVLFADGSGLSRENRVSADFMARLDEAMHASPVAHAWGDIMAVMGESGTLRHRLRGTPADGRVRGKTGTLDGVRALVGSAEAPDGARYHFAVIGNDLTGSEPWTLRLLQDEVALAISGTVEPCSGAPGEGTEALPHDVTTPGAPPRDCVR